MVTPQESNDKLAQAIGVPSIYLKREDLHPYGSHKGRSIPRMMDHYQSLGRTSFAISSSGNAALAATRHAKRLHEAGKEISLDIFVGKHADAEKISLIEADLSPGVHIEVAERPLQRLLGMTHMSNIVSLRQSTDDEALVGYYELAEELLEIKGLEAVFMGTSSGTTIQGLGECFAREGRSIRLFAVQTSSCHPFADGFDEVLHVEQSTAGAIVDKVAHRRTPVSRLLAQGGGACIVTNDELAHARSLLGVHAGIEVTANGALALAGLMRAISKGASFTGPVALIVGGK